MSTIPAPHSSPHLLKSLTSRLGLSLVLTLGLPLGLAGQEDAGPKEPPRVAMTVPLAAVPGGTTKLVVRGWHLDAATEVRAAQPGAAVKILDQGSAQVPNRQDAKQIGDTQVELELTLPESVPESIELVVVTPDGESPPYRLLAGGRFPVVAEKESNDGFGQAQPIELPQIIDGQIQQPRDVDVFSFQASAGQTIACRVLAAQHGSGLDSILMLHDARGNLLAFNDDHADSRDSKLETTLPETGLYRLTILDAHDQGGPAHPYRLEIHSP